MNDPFRPTADTRPMPAPWGEKLLIIVTVSLIAVTAAHVFSAIMSAQIAAEIEPLETVS